MTIEIEEFEVSLPAPAGHPFDIVCAYFSIRSTHENVSFCLPVLDLVGDEQPDTVQIDVDGSGSLVETWLGKTHDLIFTRDTSLRQIKVMSMTGSISRQTC